MRLNALEGGSRDTKSLHSSAASCERDIARFAILRRLFMALTCATLKDNTLKLPAYSGPHYGELFA